MSDLDTALSLLETIADGLTGLTGGCTQEPEPDPDPTTFPFATVYTQEGLYDAMSAGLLKGVHTIVLDVHQSSEVVPEAFTAAKVWPDRVAKALRDDTTLGADNCAVVWSSGVRYRAGPMEWTPERTHYVVHFEIPVKVMAIS